LSAVMIEAHVVDAEARFDARATNAALTSWGNWYIKKTGHDFGWASHYACLNYSGLFIGGHRILHDTPAHVRFVDLALGGRFPEDLRRVLVVEYWWDRDIKTGERITTREKAQAMGMESPSQFKEVVRTAKWLAQRTLGALDYRREIATLG
jgi:hypothetical protein